MRSRLCHVSGGYRGIIRFSQWGNGSPSKGANVRVRGVWESRDTPKDDSWENCTTGRGGGKRRRRLSCPLSLQFAVAKKKKKESKVFRFHLSIECLSNEWQIGLIAEARHGYIVAFQKRQSPISPISVFENPTCISRNQTNVNYSC